MSNTKQTIAFFGATGGVACSALAQALKEGYHCTALARTRQKLVDMLIAQHAIPQSTIDTQLHIHAGDVKSVPSVRKVLISPLDSSKLVDTILCGIGGQPTLRLSLVRPVGLTDPTICEDATTTILAALDALAEKDIRYTTENKKPLFVMISTTGISDRVRDVPFLLYPLYHWLLYVPHEDKKKAEHLLFSDNGERIQNFVVVRPTLLTDGEPRGAESVAAGWEWGTEGKEGVERVNEPGPRLGWSVGRKDVGAWMFRNVLVEGGWEGRCVSLTY